MTASGGVRWAAVVVLVVTLSVLALRGRPWDPGGEQATPSPSVIPTVAPTTGSNPPRTTAPATPSTPDPGLLLDVDAVAAAPPAVVRAAAVARRDSAAGGPWTDRLAQVATTGPVYVGTVSVAGDGTVTFDLVITWDPQDEVVLRFLPAAAVLGEVRPSLRATWAGAPVTATVDRAGARLFVDLPPDAGGGDGHLRLRGSYVIPQRDVVRDDGSPAGLGLLALSAGVTALGHWLPLVTLATDDGPMLPRGDVGAFPAATWSLRVTHPDDALLVTGGRESPCREVAPAAGTTCTRVTGAGLREVAAALVTDAGTGTARGVRVVAPAAVVGAGLRDGAAAEAAAYLAALADRLGALPWARVEVVAVPLAPGALGMEFPGMVWIDGGSWPRDDAGLGSYVLAHEMGHQYFHALVGNGSLSEPVVDEATAQYLAVLAFADVHGDPAASALAARSLGGRHERAVAQGVPDQAPARPLADFTSARSYGANVYGRGGQAWVDAERAAGRPTVVAILAALVDEYGLGVATARDVVRVAGEVAPLVARTLSDGWGLP